jgi:hypothetical protein
MKTIEKEIQTEIKKEKSKWWRKLLKFIKCS